jgi:hypothetical protein
MDARTASPPRRFLVLAHHEGDHQPVLDEARRLLAEAPSRFHVLVPSAPPPERWVWSESDADALARQRLAAALADFRSIGAVVSGEVADADPYDAAIDALARGPFAGVIVSTAPDGMLERLHLDLAHRLRRSARVPVTHLVARHAVKA